MSNRQRNGLFELFRSILKDPDISRENWNTPPDDIFDNVMAVIDKQSGKRRRGLILPFFFLSLILVVATIGVFGLFSGNNSDRQAQITLNQIEASPTNDKQQVETSNINDQFYSKIKNRENNNEADLMSNNHSFSKNSKAGIIDNISDPQLFTHENKINQINTEKTLSSSIVDLNISSNNNESSTHRISQVLTSIQVNPKEVVSGNQLVFEKRELLNSSLMFNQHIVSPLFYQRSFPFKLQHALAAKDNSIPLSLNIYYRKLFSSLTMKNIPESMSSNLTEYDKFYGGYLIGLSSKYLLNKNWNIEFDLSYGKYRNESKFVQELAYDKSNEVMQTPDEINYPMDIDVTTPIGTYEATISFNAKIDEIQQDEDMLNKWNIKQLINMYNISLGTNYNVNLSKRINWYAGIGMNSHFVKTVDHTLSSTLFVQNSNKLNYEVNPDEMKGTNKQFYSAYVKTGLEYQLSKHIGFDFGASYMRSFTSMLKQQDISADPATFMNILSTQIGITYKF